MRDAAGRGVTGDCVRCVLHADLGSASASHDELAAPGARLRFAGVWAPDEEPAGNEAPVLLACGAQAACDEETELAVERPLRSSTARDAISTAENPAPAPYDLLLWETP